MRFARQLAFLWYDHTGPVVTGLVLAASLASAAGGYAAADAQTVQRAALPVALPSVEPVASPDLVDVRTRERDAALERVEQLEAEIAAEAARAVEAAAESEVPAEAAHDSGTAEPQDQQVVPAQPAAEPSAPEPDAPSGDVTGACDAAVGYFSDHDRELAGVIRGDNDARRTGHSLGRDIVAMRTLSQAADRTLGGLISAYADVITGARLHLLQQGGLTNWSDDRFYATGEAVKDHCAVASDPLA